MSDLKELAVSYRNHADALRKIRDQRFPHHSFVKNGGNYCLATIGDGCPPDKIPLLHENGNTWWKPIEDCERITNLTSLPVFARRMKLRHYGYKLSGCAKTWRKPTLP